jgi:hypothetical protein
MNKGETFRDLRGGIRGVEDDDQVGVEGDDQVGVEGDDQVGVEDDDQMALRTMIRCG